MNLKINDYTKNISENEIIKIIDVEDSGNFILKLFFSDGKNQSIDFGKIILKTNNVYMKKFQNLEKFKKYKLQDGNITWGDYEMIFPLESLYLNNLN